MFRPHSAPNIGGICANTSVAVGLTDRSTRRTPASRRLLRNASGSPRGARVSAIVGQTRPRAEKYFSERRSQRLPTKNGSGGRLRPWPRLANRPVDLSGLTRALAVGPVGIPPRREPRRPGPTCHGWVSSSLRRTPRTAALARAMVAPEWAYTLVQFIVSGGVHRWSARPM